MSCEITLYKQIYPCQCAALADMGYKSVVNLRFDDEAIAQPASRDIEKAATQAGICYQHLPIDGDEIHLSIVERFAKVINELPKPVLVFCNSGSRAKRMYQNALISGLI